MAAGEVVLNSRETPLADQVHNYYADAAAIEMESAGTATAAHFNRAPFLTVRGISDKADGDKHSADQSGWQPRAATNAAAFAIAVARSVLASSVPAQAAPPTSGGQEPTQHTIATGANAYGVQYGNMRIAERTTVPDMLSWTVLAEPIEVVWRAGLVNPYNRPEPSALEAHLMPTDGARRLEVRKLNRLSLILTCWLGGPLGLRVTVLGCLAPAVWARLQLSGPLTPVPRQPWERPYREAKS